MVWLPKRTSISKDGKRVISQSHVRSVTDKIHTCVCLSKTMDNSVVYVSGHLQCSSGKVIEAFINEHVFVAHAVRIRTCVKCVR